jgi:HSP20 family protein
MARNVLRFDPLAELEALQRRFFGDVPTGVTRGVSVPTTDVYTEGDRFVIESHLPNFSEKDVEISLDDDAVTIQGQKQDREEDTRRKRYVVRETSQSFYRRVPLPERADESRVSASFENGVLKVVIPFKELPAPKRIPINIGGTGSPAPSEGQPPTP